MARTLPYHEGDWFAVPLRDNSGYAVGVVARMDGRGGVVGYFFGPRRESVPSIADVAELSSQSAILIDKLGDLRLIRANWPIIGRQNDWQREQWPMPTFCRLEEPFTGRAWKVEYDSSNLMHPIKETLSTPEECSSLPRDGLSGAGAVEILLTQLLE